MQEYFSIIIKINLIIGKIPIFLTNSAFSIQWAHFIIYTGDLS